MFPFGYEIESESGVPREGVTRNGEQAGPAMDFTLDAALVGECSSIRNALLANDGNHRYGCGVTA